MMEKAWHSHINASDWEALCDGCGLCCMHKFEDEDTGEILLTDVACRLFDASSCRCKNYAQRFAEVPDCMNIRSMSSEELMWLPPTCAYRLTYEGKPLPSWHPSNIGSGRLMHEAGVTMQNRCVSELDVDKDDLISHIIVPDDRELR